MNKKNTTFKLKEETIKKLKELAKADSRSQANMLEVLINKAHNELSKKPSN